MIQQHDAPVRPADASHLLQRLHRIGDDADDVGRVDDVERLVGKRQRRRVHPRQRDLPRAAVADVPPRLAQHRLRDVDAGDPAMGG